MKRIFLSASGRLRNGWWLLVFFAFIALTRIAYGPTTRALKQLGVSELWREPAPVLFVLLATWACTRLRGEALSSVGLVLDRRWLREWGIGLLVGMGSMALATGLIFLVGGVRFELDPARSLGALAQGFYLFACAVVLEELLFRGFLFQRLLDGTGVWFTQIALALLFAVAHWSNPGMEGATQIWATIDTALGALLLGLAYLRTRSLALPIGIHLGWNWTQGQVLGFGVSGFDQAGWWQPVFQGKADWLTGGSFGPEASVFAVLADGCVILLLWHWRGTRRGSHPAVVEGPPARAAASA